MARKQEQKGKQEDLWTKTSKAMSKLLRYGAKPQLSVWDITQQLHFDVDAETVVDCALNSKSHGHRRFELVCDRDAMFVKAAPRRSEGDSSHTQGPPQPRQMLRPQRPRQPNHPPPGVAKRAPWYPPPPPPPDRRKSQRVDADLHSEPEVEQHDAGSGSGGDAEQDRMNSKWLAMISQVVDRAARQAVEAAGEHVHAKIFAHLRGQILEHRDKRCLTLAF